jgi:lantibiotic modifying enzyme
VKATSDNLKLLENDMKKFHRNSFVSSNNNNSNKQTENKKSFSDESQVLKNLKIKKDLEISKGNLLNNTLTMHTNIGGNYSPINASFEIDDDLSLATFGN